MTSASSESEKKGLDVLLWNTVSAQEIMNT